MELLQKVIAMGVPANVADLVKRDLAILEGRSGD